MKIITSLFRSSLGKKYLMAATGLALFGFVVAHLLGNLQVFLGPEAINAYGHFLQTQPGLVWAARIGLLAAAGLHVWTAISLSRENRAARPQTYTAPKFVGASYASRTMLISGLVILTFVIYHLLHFTSQVPAINFVGTDFEKLHDAQHRHDIYHMIVLGFRQPVVAIFYVVSMALLSVHLSHGLGSMFQSLGWRSARSRRLADRFALLMAGFLVVGYSSIPLAVLAGILKEAR